MALNSVQTTRREITYFKLEPHVSWSRVITVILNRVTHPLNWHDTLICTPFPADNTFLRLCEFWNLLGLSDPSSQASIFLLSYFGHFLPIFLVFLNYRELLSERSSKHNRRLKKFETLWLNLRVKNAESYSHHDNCRNRKAKFYFGPSLTVQIKRTQYIL